MADLQALAELDLANTLEADGRAVTLLSPGGLSATVMSTANDISETIDPETNMIVPGRDFQLTYRTSSLATQPVAVNDRAQCWKLSGTTIHGQDYTARVDGVFPDGTTGMTRLLLGTL